RSNPGPVRHDTVFRDDDDPVANVIQLVVHVVRFACRRNHAAVSDTRVFVDDGVFDASAVAYADARLARRFVSLNRVEGLVVIAAEHDRAVQVAAVVQNAPDTDDTVADFGAVDDAAVGNDGVVNLRAIYFRGR